MKNNYKNIAIVFLLSVAIAIVMADLFLHHQGMSLEAEIDGFEVEPQRLFANDTFVGWKNRPGSFSVYKNDGTKMFDCTIDSLGNRVSPIQNTFGGACTNKPLIQVYGCSYIFGFSVADTSTCCHKLQQKLAGFKIENKGVPAYGLAQMFLSLQPSVAQGRIPAIAIFNYADFHDIRTADCMQWAFALQYSVLNSKQHSTEKWLLPYYSLNNNRLTINRTNINNLTAVWPTSEISAISLLLNGIYVTKHDEDNYTYRHKVSHQTALQLMSYCKAHNIIPIFATMLNTNDPNTSNENYQPTTDIANDLKSKGYFTFSYPNDVADKAYNKAPLDEGHPNELSHTIYAETMFNFLQENRLLD